MEPAGVIPSVLLRLGPLALSDTVALSLGVSLLLTFMALALVRWSHARRGRLQLLVESSVEAMHGAVADVLPAHADLVFPFVSTLWVFIGAANLVGLIPGLRAPTSDLSVTAALAFAVFLSVHWFGIRAVGARAYFKHYLQPSPILLPFHLVGELSRTLALAIRLFGNIMSLELAALLVLMVAGLLVPVPLLLLHALEAVIQAYIFGMLALVYIAGGIQSHQLGGRAQTSTQGVA
jgi:F-type H+-transporting ATPase subunit a